MSARAEYTKALRDLTTRYGLEHSQTNGGHNKLTDPTTGAVFFTAGSPGDWRAIRNVEARLRRLTR